MKSIIQISISLFGIFLVVWGVWGWFDIDFSLKGLWFYKNTFAAHPLHFSLLGVIAISYAFIDYQLNR